MPEQDTTVDNQNADAAQVGDDQGNPEGYDELGDKGKQALDRMKTERNEARTLANERKTTAERIQAEFDAYKAKHPENADRNGSNDKDNNVSDNNGQTQGKTAEQVENDVLTRLTQQALRSTVREVASATLADPEDALKLADFSEIKPNDYGEFDRTAIANKIKELTDSKPYLAKSETKFSGGADGGKRGNESTPAGGQLSRDDLKTMSPAEISKAMKDGRVKDLLSGR